MPNRSHLDRQLLTRLQGTIGKKVLKNLIGLFIEIAPKKIDTAFAAMESKNYEAVAWAAHSMISSAGNLGVVHVKDLSGLIEAAAMAGNGKKLARLLPELKSAYKKAQPELEKMLSLRRNGDS